MPIKFIALALAAATLAAACTAPGSVEWCKGVADGSIKATPEEMVANLEKCASHELAG